jgi:Flp pilus assembly protein TadB
MTVNTSQRKLGSKISFSGAFAEVPFGQARATFTHRSHSSRRWVRALAATGAVLSGSLAFMLWGAVLVVAWLGVMCWYFLLTVFGLFVIPWKIHMRSQRRASNERQQMIEALRRRDEGGGRSS